MTQIAAHRTIDAPADLVWDVVTDPDVYAAVAPNLSSVTILEGEGEGMVRRCVDTDGNAWTETCHHWEAGRGFAVAVDTATSDFHRPLFTRFEGEWRLSPRDEGVRVTIRFDFDTRYGPVGWLLTRYVQYRAVPVIESVFDGWEAEIDARLDGSDDATDDAEPPADGPPANGLYR